MLLSRRGVIAGLALAAASAARADELFTKPLHLIVGYPPGATTDYSARVIAEAVGKRLGQTMLVENRPGAGSMIGVDYVAKSPPDGTTLMYANADATSMLAAVKPNVPYDINTDFAYIARLLEFSYGICVNAQLPIKSMADFVIYAKANPGKLRYGTTGAWGGSNVVAYLLQQNAGIKLTAVPYRGIAAVVTDLLGGFIDVAVTTTATALTQSKSGKMLTLAVTSEKRSPILPDVPTMKEAGYPGVTQSDWFGVFAPAKTPAPVVARLREVFVDALADPAVGQRFVSQGLDASPLVGDAFRAFVLDQYRQGKEIAEANHITVD